MQGPEKGNPSCVQPDMNGITNPGYAACTVRPLPSPLTGFAVSSEESCAMALGLWRHSEFTSTTTEECREAQEDVRRDLVTATAASSLIASVLMGAGANLPVACAPGMGLNAYFGEHAAGGSCMHDWHACMPHAVMHVLPVADAALACMLAAYNVVGYRGQGTVRMILLLCARDSPYSTLLSYLVACCGLSIICRSSTSQHVSMTTYRA